MKKRVFIAIILTLCMLLLCSACKEDIKLDDLPPPDSTNDDVQVDNTHDKTNDDNIQPSGDNSGKPDDTANPNNTTATPNDTQKPDNTQKTYDTVLDYGNLSDENKTALQNYYAFLTGEALAYNFFNKKVTSFSEIERDGTAAISTFGLVDLGGDGILEVYMIHENTNYSNNVLFYKNGNLYVDHIPFKGTNALHSNGIFYAYAGSRTGEYQELTVSTENGLERRSIAGVSNSTDDTGKFYYICSIYENGEYLPAEQMRVTKDEYDAYVKPIDDMPYMMMFTFTTDKIQQVFLYLK